MDISWESPYDTSHEVLHNSKVGIKIRLSPDFNMLPLRTLISNNGSGANTFEIPNCGSSCILYLTLWMCHSFRSRCEGWWLSLDKCQTFYYFTFSFRSESRKHWMHKNKLIATSNFFHYFHHVFGGFILHSFVFHSSISHSPSLICTIAVRIGTIYTHTLIVRIVTCRLNVAFELINSVPTVLQVRKCWLSRFNC